MKIHDGFIVHNSSEGQVIVGTSEVGFSGLVESNEVAAFIVNRLREETTKEQVILTLMDAYDVTPSRAESGVEHVLQILRSIGALDE